MNVNTGQTYASYNDAIFAGESPADLVEVVGTKEQVERLSERVKTANDITAAQNTRARNRAKNKAARRTRRQNRK